MYESKLQIYIEILCVLVSNGPTKLAVLSAKFNLSKKHLKDQLEFLEYNGLIKKQKMGENKTLYAITKRGLTVLKVINPIIKEAHRIQLHNFEEITTALSVAGY
jgi:predicted transcriptional regulator